MSELVESLWCEQGVFFSFPCTMRFIVTCRREVSEENQSPSCLVMLKSHKPYLNKMLFPFAVVSRMRSIIKTCSLLSIQPVMWRTTPVNLSRQIVMSLMMTSSASSRSILVILALPGISLRLSWKLYKVRLREAMVWSLRLTLLLCDHLKILSEWFWAYLPALNVIMLCECIYYTDHSMSSTVVSNWVRR